MMPWPPPVDAAGFYRLDALPFVASVINLWLRNATLEYEGARQRSKDQEAFLCRADIDLDLACHLREDPKMAEFFRAQLRRWQQEPGLTDARQCEIERLEEKAGRFDAVAAALAALLREISSNLPDDDPRGTAGSLPFLPR